MLPDDPDALSAAAGDGRTFGWSKRRTDLYRRFHRRAHAAEGIDSRSSHQSKSVQRREQQHRFRSDRDFYETRRGQAARQQLLQLQRREFEFAQSIRAARAPFQVRYFGGSVSGPITRGKSSFFLDVQRRVTDDNAIINAQFSIQPRSHTFQSRFAGAKQFFSFSPRFDYQLNPGNTLVVRYSYSNTKPTTSAPQISRCRSARSAARTRRKRFR